MDAQPGDSALLVKRAVARVFTTIGSHVSVKQAIMAMLASRCRDRQDIIFNLFPSRDASACMKQIDMLKPGVDEFAAIVRTAVQYAASSVTTSGSHKEMTNVLTDMSEALRCTLAEGRQREHWKKAPVPLAVFTALHFEDPEEFVDAAVYGTVRADGRRIEELHQKIASHETQLLLLMRAVEALASGF